MQYSWSAMQAFVTCNRRYELGYRENIERIPSTSNEARLMGTCLHAAMAANLIAQNHPLKERIKIAIRDAEKALEAETIPNKFLKTAHGEVIDNMYYLMLEGIQQQLGKLVEYIVPQIDLERYYVPLVSEVIPNGAATPFVEWKFEFENFTGVIDAVLFDRDADAFIMIDWKFRDRFNSDESAALDGQLPFYAACVNAMGAHIEATRMVQIRRSTPKPAAINKDHTPSIAAQDTTWEHWVATLPTPIREKIDLDEWFIKMQHKVKGSSHYINPVEMIVTAKSSELALNNARMIVRHIEFANKEYDAGNPMTASLSDTACKFCDFLMLCRSPFKYGGDATQLIADEYQQRRSRIELADE